MEFILQTILKSAQPYVSGIHFTHKELWEASEKKRRRVMSINRTSPSIFINGLKAKLG